MSLTPERAAAAGSPSGEPLKVHRRGRHLRSLVGGGTAGNEELTAVVGLLLIALFAVVGITILRIGQLISVHLFVGLLLLGPVALKLAATGYRFVRYYARTPAYFEKGPPQLALRALAPLLILLTLTVFISGIVLMLDGPRHRGTMLMIHKVSFIVWLAFFGLHVLGHVPQLLGGSLRAVRARDHGLGDSPGGAGRAIAVSGAVVAGAVLAIVLIPDFAAWTAHGALAHHHHH